MYSSVLLTISLLFFQLSFAGSGNDASVNIKKQLKKLDPDVRIKTIEKSPIPGLYTVIIDDGYVFYISDDGNHIIRGDIIDIKDGNSLNLTEAIRNQETSKQLSMLNPHDMIIFAPKGEIKGVVYAFTDVDCGYCRKLHKEVPMLNKMGIELRYLAYPRGGAKVPAYKKMVSAWCSDDRKTAISNLKNGLSIKEKNCTNPIDQQVKLGTLLGVSGTPALFLEDGRRISGYRPAKEIARIMGISDIATP
ncbi:MAG: thioredoxin fold domain-containing protein [Candidatus Endonucleobacter bathymodioli]|uniref:Thiol:disulfide interchange protein n=1 Tax=Candidatus Endonucleibacter bathymodioli TaxID=539814 RepID=A0AA90NUM8_9GAMM|nr:thioredoxin fold domain-containing protein [Candidatus Endonucleobacter bathymodioli]